MATLTREELLRRKQQQDELAATGSITGINVKKPTQTTSTTTQTGTKSGVINEGTKTTGESPTTSTTSTSIPSTPYIVKDGRVVEVREGGGEYNPFAGLPDAERITKTREYIQQYGTAEDKARFEAQQLGVPYMTPKEQTEAAKTRLEQSVSSAKEQAKIKAAQEEATRRQQQEAISRTQSAAETAFLSGREGIQSNLGVGAGIARGVTRQLEELTRQEESQRLAAEESQKQLDYYLQTNQTKLAEAESERLSAIQTNLEKAKAARLAEERVSKTEALKVIDIISSMPAEALAAMGSAGITSLASSLGAQIDPIMATGLTASSKAILEDKALTTEQKQLQIEQLKQNFAKGLQTEAQKAVEFVTGIQNAVSSGLIDQETATNILAKQGYAEKPETPQQKADREYKEALTKASIAKISPNAQGNSINLNTVANGDPLPLGTLGNPQTMLRADRHNNPTAAKAYPTAIAQLESAGLKKGIDFNVGETTQGIDSDAVPTILYSSPDAGVRGSIALLKAGQIASWYGNKKYGGSDIVNARISQLSGKPVNFNNTQQAFNNLSAENQVEVLKTIYKHEAGSQGNFLFDTTQALAVEDPEFVTALKGSSGGKSIDATARGRLDKTFSVLDQLESLQKTLSEIPDDFKGPIAGRLAIANPYYTKAQQIEASLKALTPNLARGVYNEVGVLTDQDIQNYIKTVPNLKQTPETQKEVLMQTLDIVNSSIREQLDNAARSGVDVSDFVTKYSDAINKVKGIQEKLEAQKEDAISDAELLRSGGIIKSVEDIWETLPVNR